MMKESSASFSFQALQENHLDLLCDWLAKPHVKEWWDDHLTREEIKIKYRARIGDETVVSFIVYLDNQPLGFIQYYHAARVGNGWWPNETEGTVGIDQFIGEENCINRGIGTQMITAFTQQLSSMPEIKKIIVDVDPDNKRAMKCYEKVGFQFIELIDTPDGKAYLLSLKKLSAHM